MAQQRPTSLLVYGILNLSFGSLFLICNLCNFASMGFNAATKNQPSQGSAFGKYDEVAMQRHIENTAPGYLPVMWGAGAVSFFLILILLASGVALLSGSVIGRWGTVGYCVLVLLLEIGFASYQIGFVVPAAKGFLKSQGGPLQPGEEEGFVVGAVMGAAGGPCFVGTFALVMLTLMLLPATGKAFARDDDFGDRRWDQDDWDFQRERRPYSEW